jgi:hypothetical protein
MPQGTCPRRRRGISVTPSSSSPALCGRSMMVRKVPFRRKFSWIARTSRAMTNGEEQGQAQLRQCLRGPKTQTEAPRDGLRPRSAHRSFLLATRAAQRSLRQDLCDLFDASRPPFVGPFRITLARPQVPRFAPSLTGFPAGPWILGLPRRSRTRSAVLAALRSVPGSRPSGRCKVLRRSPFDRCLELFPCARAPLTRLKACL